MYIVSEITGKRYDTIEEAQRAETEYIKKRDAERAVKKKLEKELDDAWNEVIKAIDKFLEIGNKIEPGVSNEAKGLIDLMKTI